MHANVHSVTPFGDRKGIAIAMPSALGRHGIGGGATHDLRPPHSGEEANEACRHRHRPPHRTDSFLMPTLISATSR